MSYLHTVQYIIIDTKKQLVLDQLPSLTHAFGVWKLFDITAFDMNDQPMYFKTKKDANAAVKRLKRDQALPKRCPHVKIVEVAMDFRYSIPSQT